MAPQESKSTHHRASVEFLITLPSPRSKYASRIAEATKHAKQNPELCLANRAISRKTLKARQVIARLYQLAKEVTGAMEQVAKGQDKEGKVESTIFASVDSTPQVELMKLLMQSLKEIRESLTDCKEHT